MAIFSTETPKSRHRRGGQLSVSARDMADMAADLLAATDRPAVERRRRLLTLANRLSDLRASPSTGANRKPPTMLDELNLEAEANPTVDEDRLIFSAPDTGGNRRVIGFRPRFWTLGPWNTEPSGNRPPRPTPGPSPSFEVQASEIFAKEFWICGSRCADSLETRTMGSINDQKERANEFILLGLCQKLCLAQKLTWTSHISQ